MQKEELLTKIDELPLFRLRDVAVKEIEVIEPEPNNEAPYGQEDKEIERWEQQEKHQAVTETNSVEAIAFVSDKYQLVQFKEMFVPIVEKMGDCEGSLAYYFGFAIMDIFPAQEEYKINGDRIGIVAYNSVDKTSALNIRFCVEHNGRKITIPKKVASFRKVHLGNIGQMTQDYISVITKIKNSWKTIMDKFINFDVKEEDLQTIAENFKIDEHSLKHMKKKMLLGKQYNLWDFCMEVFDHLSRKTFKSDVHRRKRLDKFVTAIFDYELVMEI